jgi:hypothetical protein
MFLRPWLIWMSIAATRMHRALTNFGSTDMCGFSFRRSLLLFSHCVRRQSQLLRKCPEQPSPAFSPKAQGCSRHHHPAPPSGGCKHDQRGISCVTGPSWPVHERERASSCGRAPRPNSRPPTRNSALDELKPYGMEASLRASGGFIRRRHGSRVSFPRTMSMILGALCNPHSTGTAQMRVVPSCYVIYMIFIE